MKIVPLGHMHRGLGAGGGFGCNGYGSDSGTSHQFLFYFMTFSPPALQQEELPRNPHPKLRDMHQYTAWLIADCNCQNVNAA